MTAANPSPNHCPGLYSELGASMSHESSAFKQVFEWHLLACLLCLQNSPYKTSRKQIQRAAASLGATTSWMLQSSRAGGWPTGAAMMEGLLAAEPAEPAASRNSKG